MIGKKIKFSRVEKGLTQERLAECLGVSAQAVSKWERGMTYPDISVIPLLSKALGVSADALLGIENESKDKQHASFLETFHLWQKGHKSEDMYWMAREAHAAYPHDATFEFWLASVEFWLAFEENLKPNPDREYFNDFMENALRRFDSVIESCPDAAMKSCAVLGKITVLRFWERIYEADWSAEFEYPDPDITTSEQALALWRQGREVLLYLQNESNR